MPPTLAGRPFLRMNGLGNAILVVDLRGTPGLVPPADARALAARPATRFDQLMALHDPRTPGTDAYVTITNADGSPAGACGNGMRCVAHALLRGGARDTCLPETVAGILLARRLSAWSYEVDMGAPRFGWAEVPLAEPFADTRTIELQVGPIDAPVLHSPSALSVGNPHAVFWVEDAAAHDLPRVGPLLENHPIFPERANISLAQVLAPDRLRLRVWERGAGETLACGSAACAAAVAAHRKGFTGREVTVELPGGELRIHWREGDDHVLMAGPVELEREGVLEPGMLAAAG